MPSPFRGPTGSPDWNHRGGTNSKAGMWPLPSPRTSLTAVLGSPRLLHPLPYPRHLHSPSLPSPVPATPRPPSGVQSCLQEPSAQQGEVQRKRLVCVDGGHPTLRSEGNGPVSSAPSSSLCTLCPALPAPQGGPAHGPVSSESRRGTFL